MKYQINEDELLDKLIPKIDARISSRIAQKIIDALKDELYPPEEMIRDEFIKEIEKADKEKGVTFKNRDELESYLKGLAD